jgi:hypothetical protein
VIETPPVGTRYERAAPNSNRIIDERPAPKSWWGAIAQVQADIRPWHYEPLDVSVEVADIQPLVFTRLHLGAALLEHDRTGAISIGVRQMKTDEEDA